MKKLTLSFLVLGFMFIMVGVVSAGNIIITIGGITSPSDGTYIGDSVLIEWENGNFQDAMLKYSPGLCNNYTGTTTLAGHIDPDGEYLWDLSNLEDNKYCVKIIDGNITYYNVSVIKDTTAPTVEFLDTPYFKGTSEVVPIKINISEANEIDEWELDFGDESTEEDNTDGEIDVPHDYDEEGEYVITIIVTDKAGNIAVETAMIVISDEEKEWVIPLYADKMNLFSIPLIPEDSDIEEVLEKHVSDNAEKIWSYQQGSWKWNTPTSSGWLSTSSRIQKIVPGYGYIIFMNEDSVAYGNGKELGADFPPEVVLTTGWNLIGHYGLKILDISDAFSSLELGDNYYWNSLLTVNEDDEFVSTSTLEPGKAYWLSIKGINMEDDDELRYFRYLPSQDAY